MCSHHTWPVLPVLKPVSVSLLDRTRKHTETYLQVRVFNGGLIESSPLVLFSTGLLQVQKVASDWSPPRVERGLPLQNQGVLPDLAVPETVRWTWAGQQEAAGEGSEWKGKPGPQEGPSGLSLQCSMKRGVCVSPPPCCLSFPSPVSGAGGDGCARHPPGRLAASQAGPGPAWRPLTNTGSLRLCFPFLLHDNLKPPLHLKPWKKATPLDLRLRTDGSSSFWGDRVPPSTPHIPGMVKGKSDSVWLANTFHHSKRHSPRVHGPWISVK